MQAEKQDIQGDAESTDSVCNASDTDKVGEGR